MSCPRCGGKHRGWEPCTVKAANYATNTSQIATNKESHPATNADPIATNAKTANRRDRKDYNEYQRFYMQSIRAIKSGRAVPIRGS